MADKWVSFRSASTALSNASVDAANRLTTFGTQTLTYDANGNLTSDGNKTYSWNARNQLTQIKKGSGEIVASFTYDGLGRRQTKKVGGVATGYIYDGLNIIQELTGMNTDNSNAADVRASYISGGVDEVFAQLSGVGADAKIDVYLTDALGSTIRLLDSAGKKLTDYTYDPYGVTAIDGYSANPFQYAGRENDETGLYYYRARYYSPTLGRFISMDPIGLNGGINIYSYVDENPISNLDPFGLWSISVGLFAGPGAQVSFGQNPNGSGFMSLQFGWGIGGGVSYDPLGQQAGYDPSQGNDWGISTGLYAQANFRDGPMSASVGPNFGRDFYLGDKCNQSYGNKGKPKFSFKDSLAGFKASASAGGQITVFGGGEK